MILVTGPTGNTGGEIVKRLSEAGRPFRCMSSRPETVQRLQDQGLNAMHGDFDSPDTLASALEGIERAYLVCPPDERLADREKTFIDAAKAAGVSRLVKLSAFWAAPGSESPNLHNHGVVEQYLQDSGIPFTILRPHGFIQTFYWMNAPAIAAQSVMAVPGGQGVAPLLDLRDVAEAAYVALVDDGHEGQIYNLTGPKTVSMADIAQILSGALGQQIHYVDLPEEEMIGRMKMMGVPDSSVTHVTTVFRWIREGKSEEVTDAFGQLGITPRTCEQFGEDLAAGVTGAATSFEPPPPPGS